MARIDRRTFLESTAGATFLGATAGAAQQGDSDIANSRPAPLGEDDRDPLGLSKKEPLTPEMVRRAIDRGIEYLKRKQLENGTWPNQWHYDGGLTSLCTLALLNAGCGPEDAAVARSLAYLREYVPRSTYTTSLQTMVFCAAEPGKYSGLIARNVKWLDRRQHKDGLQQGMWAIEHMPSTDHTDNSMSHFAILALHEAERAGIAVDPQTWKLAQQHWQSTQSDDGSWGWGPKHPGSGSMTCAGIAALIITSGVLSSSDAALRGSEVVGCGVQQQDAHLEKAIQWMSRNFSVYRNPGTEFWLSYYLYAMERAGRMSGRRFIGPHDWYREGAQMLAATQGFLGEWPPDLEFRAVGDKCVSTSFSLMFMAKGRWPVVMAHLKRLPVDDWNRHRGALANLVGHLERSWERSLTHQVVDLAQATVEDLLESPVLFLNGRDHLQLTGEEQKKLRMYVDRGGFLFVERCCGGNGFDDDFRAAVREVFPEPECELRPLPPDHPVWYMDHPVSPKLQPTLWGIDVSCRTGVIYCPEDLSSYWELDRVGREQPELAAVREKLVAARNVGLNILTYATGREVSFKTPALAVAAAGAADSTFDRGAIYVANVLHPGGCHAAPAALRNLLKRATEDFQLSVSREPREVGLSDPSLFHFALIFFHGRTAFELTPAERTHLRSYLERGGTVLADAVCSNAEFAKSFRSEMNAIFPDRPLRPIPASDPIFTPDYGGADVTKVTYREPRSLLVGSAERPAARQAAPQLEGLEIDGRYAVLFSPLDISCALETEPIGCTGYARRDAILLAINVLFYSLNQ